MAAVRHGADAIGLVFVESSPRHVDIAQAKAAILGLPPFITVVGLFVDADPSYIERVLQEVHLDMLQFHGDESPEECQRYARPYMKAIRVRPDTNLLQYALDYQRASALLLDAHVEGVAGGTGQRFDWTLIPADLPMPIVLAGGLNAENVAGAIKQVRPYAVDVSGGVESQKGIKDAGKIAAFMRGVTDAAL
jgi:phosphoribosylanthranilate isomerase